MNPLDALFRRLRAGGRTAFLPFLPAGDPSLAVTAELLRAAAGAGASAIEVGFPFSDPIADGPVIQASYTRALAHRITLADTFAMLGGVTAAPGWGTPLVAMASYSLVWRRGPERFVADARAAGLCGAVVPDLPAEEADEFAAVCRSADFKLVLLVTPTTSPERAEKVVAACGGFVYVVSVVGITGERDRLPDTLHAQIGRLRAMTDLPLCVGFGVSTPAHVAQVAEVADGVIVGTAVVKALAGAPDPLAAVRAKITELVGGLSGSRTATCEK
jgi:tryptophan synthase alpha chain